MPANHPLAAAPGQRKPFGRSRLTVTRFAKAARTALAQRRGRLAGRLTVTVATASGTRTSVVRTVRLR